MNDFKHISCCRTLLAVQPWRQRATVSYVKLTTNWQTYSPIISILLHFVLLHMVGLVPEHSVRLSGCLAQEAMCRCIWCVMDHKSKVLPCALQRNKYRWSGTRHLMPRMSWQAGLSHNMSPCIIFTRSTWINNHMSSSIFFAIPTDFTLKIGDSRARQLFKCLINFVFQLGLGRDVLIHKQANL